MRENLQYLCGKLYQRKNNLSVFSKSVFFKVANNTKQKKKKIVMCLFKKTKCVK